MTGRIIQGSGIFFGTLAGIYLNELVLPHDAGLWSRMAVGLLIAVAVWFLFYRFGAAFSRRVRT